MSQLDPDASRTTDGAVLGWRAASFAHPGAFAAAVLALAFITFRRWRDAGTDPLFEPFRALGLVPFVTPFALFALEVAAVGWERSTARAFLRSPSISLAYDLVQRLILETTFYKVLQFLFSLGASLLITLWLAGEAHDLSWRLGRVNTGFLALDTLLFGLAFSFFDYWDHRLSHTGPFWYLHRFHHSATEMSLVTHARNHPAGKLFTPFLFAWPYLLFDFPPAAAALFLYLNEMQQMVLHSRTGWSYGWFGDWILMSPRAHWIHHSPLPEHADRNLSNITPLWDRLFGTWYDGDVLNTEIGIREARHNTGNVVLEWLDDLRAFLRAVFSGRRPA